MTNCLPSAPFTSQRLTDCIWGLCKITLPGDPPIAGQSRSNRGPTDSNRGATLVIAAVSIRFSLFYLKRWPSSIHTWKLEGRDVARMGRASLVKFVQSPSNCGPIAELGGETLVCSFQSLPKSRFRQHSLNLDRRNQHTAFKKKLFRERVQSKCARRASGAQSKHHAASEFTIIALPFRGPIAGLSRLEFFQSRGSTSCRCS